MRGGAPYSVTVRTPSLPSLRCSVLLWMKGKYLCSSFALSDVLAYPGQALMKWLQAEVRPEAPQPPGLTVDLHPYQRQSLKFMLENEQGEGGHRRHFWVPYKTPSGFTFWWSPLFNRASREVAPCPWGGFLAEEMVCWGPPTGVDLMDSCKVYTVVWQPTCTLADKGWLSHAGLRQDRRNPGPDPVQPGSARRIIWHCASRRLHCELVAPSTLDIAFIYTVFWIVQGFDHL